MFDRLISTKTQFRFRLMTPTLKYFSTMEKKSCGLGRVNTDHDTTETVRETDHCHNCTSIY